MMKVSKDNQILKKTSTALVPMLLQHQKRLLFKGKKLNQRKQAKNRNQRHQKEEEGGDLLKMYKKKIFHLLKICNPLLGG